MNKINLIYLILHSHIYIINYKIQAVIHINLLYQKKDNYNKI